MNRNEELLSRLIKLLNLNSIKVEGNTVKGRFGEFTLPSIPANTISSTKHIYR